MFVLHVLVNSDVAAAYCGFSVGFYHRHTIYLQRKPSLVHLIIRKMSKQTRITDTGIEYPEFEALKSLFGQTKSNKLIRLLTMQLLLASNFQHVPLFSKKMPLPYHAGSSPTVPSSNLCRRKTCRKPAYL